MGVFPAKFTVWLRAAASLISTCSHVCNKQEYERHRPKEFPKIVEM
jgi:hypothetical protein